MPSFPAEDQTAAGSAAFADVMRPIVVNIVNPLIQLAFAVAVVVFAYGVIQMITHKTDAEAHMKGRWSMLGGLIGIFIMLSAWGIIRLISNTVWEFSPN